MASVRLWGLFVLLSGIPLVVLGFLAWRLVEQDRALETQRLRERLDNNSAALIVHELDRRFADWENFLEKSGESSSETLTAKRVPGAELARRVPIHSKRNRTNIAFP
jgi:hypothetical protein